MFEFKDLGIKPKTKAFTGDKINIDYILNKRILVHAFKIDKSKFEKGGNGNRLTLQIDVDNSQRIVFTGSVNLQEMIKQVPEGKFPFSTVIIKKDKRYEFT
jgi:hypothetical protein